ETDIQEKDKKKAKDKQNRARNGKDKVKSKPNFGWAYGHTSLFEQARAWSILCFNPVLEHGVALSEASIYRSKVDQGLTKMGVKVECKLRPLEEEEKLEWWFEQDIDKEEERFEGDEDGGENEEFDIWDMEMEPFTLSTLIMKVWKVIQNETPRREFQTGKDWYLYEYCSPVTAAEIQLLKKREKQEFLLMAIPKENINEKISGMDDAKEIWEASERFGGNANSKGKCKRLFSNKLYEGI
ncbi:hypothetical protein Tco_0632398, partial [Tanacetum coccineum]